MNILIITLIHTSFFLNSLPFMSFSYLFHQSQANFFHFLSYKIHLSNENLPIHNEIFPLSSRNIHATPLSSPVQSA